MADDSRNGGGIGRWQCRVLLFALSVTLAAFELMFRLQSPPFFIRFLGHKDNHGADAYRYDNNQLLSLLPASDRTESDNLAALAHHITACVEKELDLRRDQYSRLA
ncbi:hypothetical protein AUP68_06519 [Ilyonectria robusta]